MLSKNKIALLLLSLLAVSVSCSQAIKSNVGDGSPKSSNAAYEQSQGAAAVNTNEAANTTSEVSKSDAKIYEPPQRLILSADESTSNNDAEFSTKLLTETFYPIGWSKDGKFAYYTEPADEACGCYFAKLIIQDLRTDKILWEHSNTKEEIRDDNKEETIENYWRKHREEFSRKLAQYEIVPQKDFALLDSSINYQTDVLTPKLAVNIKTDDVFSVDGDVVLSMISREKGSKTLYEKKYDPKEIEGFRDAKISGSLLSPFEARAAVVMIEIYRGYEGPPNTTRVKIVGSALTTGFGS